MKVVIADDSQLILTRIQEKVGMYKGVEIVGAYKNGTDTLAALKFFKPDLAIVDINMPGLNGLDVLEEIRKEDTSLMFVILTFNSSEFYRRKAVELGVDYFLSKVDDEDKLSQVIEEMLREEKKMKVLIHHKANTFNGHSINGIH